jgi:hypothetical protein
VRVFLFEESLALQIARLDVVAIDDPDVADSRTRQQ